MTDSERAPLTQPELDSDSDDEEGEQAEKAGFVFLGHEWHWSEGLFILLVIFGLIEITLNAITFDFIPAVVAKFIYMGASVTGCALVWNLASIQRIAATTEFLQKDLNRFKAENERARAMQATFKKQDAQMKQNLADLQSASLLLSGATQDLEGVQEEEKKMIEDRANFIEKRKEVAERLITNLKALWKLSIEAAKQEVYDRSVSVFEDLAEEDPKLNDIVIYVKSEKFDQLNALLAKYGLETDQDGTGQDMVRLKKFAGPDMFLNADEFEEWLGAELDLHFERLTQTLIHNIKMRNEIEDLELKLAGMA